MGVDRIGHAVLLDDDPVTVEYVRRHMTNLGIEANIISNLKLGVVGDPLQHPFLKYIRLGFAVIRASFAADAEKSTLTNKLKQDMTKFEQKWKQKGFGK